MTALGVTLPVMPAFAGLNMKTPYDPGAKFDVKVSEIEYRRTKAGRALMARIYQPSGAAYVTRYTTLMEQGHILGEDNRGVVMGFEASVNVETAAGAVAIALGEPAGGVKDQLEPQPRQGGAADRLEHREEIAAQRRTVRGDETQ